MRVLISIQFVVIDDKIRLPAEMEGERIMQSMLQHANQIFGQAR